MKDNSYELKQQAAPGISKRNFIYAEVQFGNPKAECRNFGICKIVEINDLLPIKYRIPNRSIAKISVKENFQIEFKFILKYLSTEAKTAYFEKGYFLIEEAFVFPEYVFQEQTEQLIIKPDNYLVRTTKNYLSITTNLRIPKN